MGVVSGWEVWTWEPALVWIRQPLLGQQVGELTSRPTFFYVNESTGHMIRKKTHLCHCPSCPAWMVTQTDKSCERELCESADPLLSGTDTNQL